MWSHKHGRHNHRHEHELKVEFVGSTNSYINILWKLQHHLTKPIVNVRASSLFNNIVKSDYLAFGRSSLCPLFVREIKNLRPLLVQPYCTVDLAFIYGFC